MVIDLAVHAFLHQGSKTSCGCLGQELHVLKNFLVMGVGFLAPFIAERVIILICHSRHGMHHSPVGGILLLRSQRLFLQTFHHGSQRVG